MSNMYNDIILERYYDDALELTTTELAKSLDLPIDALGLKPFADTPIKPIVGQEILFTGYDIFTHDELAIKVANQTFEAGSA